MGLVEAIGKKLLIRRLERLQRSMMEGTVKLSVGTKVAAVAFVLVVVQAALDATREYFKVDITPTVAEWGRTVAVAILGAFLYWLRSPKDAGMDVPPAPPEDR